MPTFHWYALFFVLTSWGEGKQFGSLQVIKDVSVSIGKGKVVCIIGPSGSGKSTFLCSLIHLEKITSGRIKSRDRF